MPRLRTQLLAWVETFSDLATSAEERFREAEHLLAAGRPRGCIYLLGLASEMWLKLGSFRLLGARAADPVGPYARQVRIFMDAYAPLAEREAGHSLRYWAEFVVRYRALLANPLPAHLLGGIRHHVLNRLYLDWKIDLRYRPVVVSPELARRVLADTASMRGQWERLGR